MKLLLCAWLAQGILATLALSLLVPWDTPWQPVAFGFGWPLLFLPTSTRCPVNKYGQLD